jgi:hypothetical protein
MERERELEREVGVRRSVRRGGREMRRGRAGLGF